MFHPRATLASLITALLFINSPWALADPPDMANLAKGIWIDPQQNLYVIFLSNRVHPDGNGSVNSLIGRIGTVSRDGSPP